MHNGHALIPGGDTDEGQLDVMFRKLGTPTEEVYPTLTALPHWAVRACLC